MKNYNNNFEDLKKNLLKMYEVKLTCVQKACLFFIPTFFFQKLNNVTTDGRFIKTENISKYFKIQYINK